MRTVLTYIDIVSSEIDRMLQKLAWLEIWTISLLKLKTVSFNCCYHFCLVVLLYSPTPLLHIIWSVFSTCVVWKRNFNHTHAHASLTLDHWYQSSYLKSCFGLFCSPWRSWWCLKIETSRPNVQNEVLEIPQKKGIQIYIKKIENEIRKKEEVGKKEKG